MKISHHPDDATLMSFAAGSLPEALAAVAAGHLAMCPRCASEVARMERLGACLLGALRPAAVTRPAPSPATSRGASREGAARPAGGSFNLELLLGSDLDAVRWRWLALGVWHRPITLPPGTSGGLRLLKVAPGQSIPEHGHAGSELTLVLRGSYTDETGCYGAGDVADLDEDIEHRPIADGETGCICLLASEKLARFKGVLPRILQPFTRI